MDRRRMGIVLPAPGTKNPGARLTPNRQTCNQRQFPRPEDLAGDAARGGRVESAAGGRNGRRALRFWKDIAAAAEGQQRGKSQQREEEIPSASLQGNVLKRKTSR